MAEANEGTGSGAQGAAGNNPSGGIADNGSAQSGGQSGQGQEPKWLNYVPEHEREEARKSYLLHSDYTRKTQELSERSKSWEAEKKALKEREQALEAWWKQNEPSLNVAAQNWDKFQYALQNWDSIEAWRKGNQGQANQGEDPFKDYDLLPANEQAKRMYEFVRQGIMQNEGAQFSRSLEQKMAERDRYYQNYINTLVDAFAKKADNPALDVNQYIQKVMEFSFGKFNPSDMAFQALTKDSDLKKMQEEWLKKGREEGQLEERNKRQPAGPTTASVMPVFKQPAMTREQVAESVRQKMIEKGIPWT